MSWFHSPLEVTYAAAISACEKGEGPLRDVSFREVRGDQFQPYPETEAVQMMQDTDQDTKTAVGSSYKFLKCRWNDFCSFLDRRTKVPALMTGRTLGRSSWPIGTHASRASWFGLLLRRLKLHSTIEGSSLSVDRYRVIDNDTRGWTWCIASCFDLCWPCVFHFC